MRKGSSFSMSGVLLLYIKKSQINSTRIGIAVTKKYGKANKRNRAKRIIRDVFRNSDFRSSGYNIVVAMNIKKINREKLDFPFVESQISESLSLGLKNTLR